MKKAILLVALGAATSLYAQTPNKAHVASPATTTTTLDQTRAIDPAGANHSFVAETSPAEAQSLGKYRSQVYDFVNIGTSYYDLQTNASIGRRAMLHSDGSITAAWTFSGAQSTSWPDRGTGINHYDGTSWGTFPTTRTESSRTGWPSIGMLADGSMYTIAHDFDGGGLIMTTNTGKGKTDWTTLADKLAYNGGEPIWNRTANNGDIMHVLTNFSGQSNVDDVFIDGLVNPTTYSRSLDGGKTWADEHILLPGYDTLRYVGGGGDTYAIDVRDSVVAIVIGGLGRDLAIWKSMDNGDTWTKTIADSFRFPAYVWGSELIPAEDFAPSSDGAHDIIIDNNNNAHVVFGRMGLIDTDTTDDGIGLSSFFSLYHWSENEPEVKVCGSPIDMDNSGISGAPYDFAAETTNSMDANGVPQQGLSYAARYGNTSISTHPSLSVDASNRIFVTFDAPVEYTFHDYGANFRDVHIGYSTDGGKTWQATQNATQIRYKECAFACLTKTTNDFVHFIFQEDEHPGTNLQNNGSGGLHPNVENKIQYAAIPVQDILDGNLGQNDLSSPQMDRDAKVFVVSQNYPNPFSSSTNVVIYMRAGADLSYTITDATGKVVDQKELGYKHAGNHDVTINGDHLTNGMYFFTLRTDDSEVTRKMNVVK